MSLLGGLVGAGIGYLSARKQADEAEFSAEKSRAWQEYMYDHRYQKTVEDLKAAGLNPILAVGSGLSGSSPSGAKADVPDYSSAMSHGVNSALSVVKAVEEIKNIRQNTRKVSLEADTKEPSGAVGKDKAKIYDRVKDALFKPYPTSSRKVTPLDGALINKSKSKRSIKSYSPHEIDRLAEQAVKSLGY